MAKIPSRGFSKTKQKIPSRGFAKSTTKMASKKLATGTSKFASRKFSKTAEPKEKPKTPASLDQSADEQTRQDRLEKLKVQAKLLPASNLQLRFLTSSL